MAFPFALSRRMNSEATFAPDGVLASDQPLFANTVSRTMYSRKGPKNFGRGIATLLSKGEGSEITVAIRPGRGCVSRS